MTQKITEQQLRDIVREALTEAIGFGFSLGYLKTIPSYAKRMEYCKQYLGKPIGKGSSRMCFQLDDEHILKLAINEKGIAQNEKEGQQDYYRDSYGIFPKVYYNLSDEDNYSFIVSEYVLPVKSKDFIKCLGMTGDFFYNFLEACASQYNREFRMHMSNEEFQNLLENNEELEKWYSFMSDYQMPAYDLRNANFGMALRGGEPTIVMLDSGLDDYIYKKYYK